MLDLFCCFKIEFLSHGVSFFPKYLNFSKTKFRLFSSLRVTRNDFNIIQILRKNERGGCLLCTWLSNFASALPILATIPKYQKIETSFLDLSGKRSKIFVKLITNKQFMQRPHETTEKSRGERP